RDELSFVDAWHEPAPALLQFTADCREQRFPRGVGLPGRVWQGDDPAWMQDVHDDPNFPRASSAERAGLHAAFAAPIVLGGETLGVMEFLAPEIRARDEDVLSALAAVGSQIGQFVRRRRAESELRESRDELEAVLAGVREGILVEHRGGRFAFANQAAAMLLGYPSVIALLESSVHEVFGRFEIEDEDGRTITRAKVPRLADWCLVDTMQPDGTLLPVAMGHSDPAKLELARRLRERHPADPHQPFGAPRVARTGRSELYAEIPPELRSAPALGHLELA